MTTLFDDHTARCCELCGATVLDADLSDWALPHGVIVRACDSCDTAARELQDAERAAS